MPPSEEQGRKAPAPRTVPLPLALVGITVAALAEAMQIRAANEPDHLGDVITTCAQTLSGLGQVTAGAAPKHAGNPAGILFPPALLRRAARYISGARRPGRERWQAPGRDSRDITQPTGREPAPGR